MDREMLTDQRELVELIESAGWEVTGLELSSYDSPWVDEDAPEAEVTITARKPYLEDETEDENDESPFRISD
ncbi:hypothetical protein ACLI4R_05490 [Natrialbaceae archaeon A-chndr2]